MTTGAPSDPPNWLNLNGGRALPARFANQSLALSLSLRRNSYSVACGSLVPDLVMTLKIPPDARPYSALKLLVSTLNSSTASGLALITGWFCEGAVLGAPSRRNSLALAPFRLMGVDTVVIGAIAAC